jgi:hypothetical protein
LDTLRGGYEKATDSERGRNYRLPDSYAHDGQSVEGPGYFGQHHPTFNAVFFEDPLSNRLEVCHHRWTNSVTFAEARRACRDAGHHQPNIYARDRLGALKAKAADLFLGHSSGEVWKPAI